jgi:hypothetical protein
MPEVCAYALSECMWRLKGGEWRCASLAEDCLILGAALAHNIPARVLEQLSGTELLRPQSLLQAGPLSIASSGAALRFVEQTVPGLRELQKVSSHGKAGLWLSNCVRNGTCAHPLEWGPKVVC